MLRDSQVKVAVALLQLAQEARRGQTQTDVTETVTLSVSPMELSARVGLDVDTVKRNVQQLRTAGYVVIEGEQVLLPDTEGLRELRRLLEMKDEIAGASDARATRRGE